MSREKNQLLPKFSTSSQLLPAGNRAHNFSTSSFRYPISAKETMNSLRLRSLAQQVVRQKRTKATMSENAFPKRNKKEGIKQAWLSDPSTYPIIAIMGGGLTFMVCMIGNALFTYKQVDISPNQRGRTMKQYSPEHRTGVVERFTLAKGGVKSEGLGIDHEKWTKEKEDYLNK